MKLDLDLARKYSRPGPRYTSYPTAPQFSEAVGADHYLRELTDPDVPVTPKISLYFHLPFCPSLCTFCACSVIITSRRDHIADYLRVLKQEINLLATYLGSERKVGQLHWGGGTPTYLTAAEIRSLMAHIRGRFEFSPEAEVSVEIDPREMTEDRALALADAGFNRVSCGLQDFDEKVQQTINRIQPYQLTEHVLNMLRQAGFNDINLDLIYGLPHQTLAGFGRTLEQVLTLNPSRLAVYNYAHVPWLKKHQKLLKEEWLPGPDLKLELLAHIIDYLTTEGDMVFIGMDHFAKPGDELALALQNGGLHRNFQGYSTQAGLDMYALGITSIGHTHNYYLQNHKRLSTYKQLVGNGRLPTQRGLLLTVDDHLRRRIIQDIMCRFELDIPAIEAEFEIEFGRYFDAELAALKPFEDDRLLQAGPHQLNITQKGRRFIRNIAMVFDAYLPGNGDGAPADKSPASRFSQTI